jgi:PAS domain-containing protein
MAFDASNQRSALRLVAVPQTDPATAPAEHVWFCSHCGERRDDIDPPAPHARVCESCSLGLLMEAREDLAPAPGDPFLLVDDRLRVHGMSAGAERLLGLIESEGQGRPIGELLVAPDAEPARGNSLSAMIADVASGGEAEATTYLRPWNTFGVRMRARISSCGPPRAVLIVLGGSPQLRAV